MLVGCFYNQVRKFVGKKFNYDLAEETGLSPGDKKIFYGFKIDKNGNIMNIQARAPHPKIKNEIINILKKLPKMKPGRGKDGKLVIVKYYGEFIYTVE